MSTDLEPTSDDVVALPAAPVLLRPDSNPYLVYRARLTGESRRAMIGCLDRVARLVAGVDLDDSTVTGETFPWHQLTYARVSLIRTLLVEHERRWSPPYVNKHLVAVRMVLKEAWRLGLMSAEQYQRAADVEALKYSRLPAGRSVSGEEMAALLDACDPDTTIGVRDAAVLAIAMATGMRREELVGLDLQHWTPAARSLRVRGKGDKERLVYAPPWAARTLNSWLRVRGRHPGPLFQPVLKNGRVVDRRLSAQTVADVLAKRTIEAGTAHASPHDMRRTFVGELLDNGVDLVTVQGLAGHASPTTTSRYDRRAEQVRADAASKFKDPRTRHGGAR